jgi:hypothetical protein
MEGSIKLGTFLKANNICKQGMPLIIQAIITFIDKSE